MSDKDDSFEKVIQCEGKTYTLADVPFEELTEDAEEYIASKRRPPAMVVAMLLDALEKFPDAQEKLIKIAYEDAKNSSKPPTKVEVKEWIETDEGISWTFWKMLKPNHPELTVLSVKRLLRKVQAEAISEKLKKDRLDSAAKNEELKALRDEAAKNVEGKIV